MTKILLLSCLLLGLAQAQPLMGTVYGVFPEGVMLSQGGSSMLVPFQHASFQMNGVQVQFSQLLPGQAVQVVVPPSYLPQVQSIPDPYAWKMKYHPGHPHGGPPGQMKKSKGRKR